jgi:hypothetical protein
VLLINEWGSHVSGSQGIRGAESTLVQLATVLLEKKLHAGENDQIIEYIRFLAAVLCMLQNVA